MHLEVVSGRDTGALPRQPGIDSSRCRLHSFIRTTPVIWSRNSTWPGAGRIKVGTTSPRQGRASGGEDQTMQERVKVFTFFSGHGETVVEPPHEDHINQWL